MIDLLLQDIKEGVLMQNRAIKYRIYEYLAEYHAHRIPRMSVDECG